MPESRVHFTDFRPDTGSLREQVIEGLSRDQKSLPPKLFYDAEGSRLFDRITRLEEYYLTRTEINLLERHGEEIADSVARDSLVIELGSGSRRKIRVLLEAVQPAAYLPVDISAEHLYREALDLARETPDLEIYATCADYTAGLELDHAPRDLPRLGFFPGSSVGNFEPAQAEQLLARLRRALGADGLCLIGVDLEKEQRILHAAYNDAQGVTARFNLNMLARLNRELGADFDLSAFRHRAFYNEQRHRVEMHLVSAREQSVRLDGHRFSLAAGETIHTENSYKYSLERFQGLADSAGFSLLRQWTDPEQLFSLHLLAA